jgi:hypothetical protein
MNIHARFGIMSGDEVRIKKDRDPIMVVCFVVFLLASVAVIGATVYNDYVKADDTLVAPGDSVSVNYTGTYYAYFGESNAVVFDTSYWSVANDKNVIKSNDFTARSESAYTPLKFTVGGNEVLADFGNATIGHKVGDTVRVLVAADRGYVSAGTDKTVSTSESIKIPTVQKLTSAQFESIYEFKLLGRANDLKSPYGWLADASYNTSDDTVTLYYKPTVDQSYTITDETFGKVAVSVTSVSSTEISFRYVVSAYKVVNSVGADKEIEMIKVNLGTEVFYIKSVVDNNGDGIAESFTYKTEGERYNQPLYFEIKLVSIN